MADPLQNITNIDQTGTTFPANLLSPQVKSPDINQVLKETEKGYQDLGKKFLETTKPLMDAYGKGLQAEQDIATEKEMQLNLANKAKSQLKAEAYRKEVEDVTKSKAYDDYDKVVNQLENQEFVPTKENAQDLAQLFTYISLIGFGIGKGGKGSAQAAMSAMSGMMEGHLQGREDRYKKEKDIFETNVKALREKAQVLNDRLKKITELAATNRQAAELQADELFYEMNADFYKSIKDKQGLMVAAKLAEKNFELSEKAFDIMERQFEATSKVKTELAMLGIRQQLKGASTEGELVQQFTGVMPSPKDATEITTIAGAMGEAYALSNIARTMPDVVGRSGQIQSLVDKYVKSYTGAGALPTADDESGLSQEALIFAKRYAAYLVGYERSLSGSARAFTVQLQKRFNALMAQEQFTPEGLSNLLIDHTRELSNSAAEKGRAFNIDNMSKMAIDISSRTGDPNAIYGYQYALQKRSGAAPTSQVPTFATEAEAEQAAKEGKIQKGTKIIIGGQSGTWQ